MATVCAEVEPDVLLICKKASAARLLDILTSINGSKDLIIDKDLICSLDYIATFSQLKECKVEKIFKLEPGQSPGQTDKCVYLVRPKLLNACIISDHINADLSVERNKYYWIIYVPRKLYTCDKIFEKEGIYGYINQIDLPLSFFTLDKDLALLEINDFYKSFFLRGDLTHLHAAALSLAQLYNVCGPIPKIFGQGRCAKMVLSLMSQMVNGTAFPKASPSKLSHLIIVDRDIDYPSVLLSQLTYEGLLDDTFGIKSGRVTFPKQVLNKEAIKVVLNSSDVVYEEIRNCFFASVFGLLRDKAKELQAKSETSTMTLENIKEFVAKDIKDVRRQQQSLALHIGTCEYIMEKENADKFQTRLQFETGIIENQNLKECISYIEDVINRQEASSSALRLLCLLSIAHDGLVSSDYKSLATQFYQSYGSKHTITLHNLKKTGLFVEQPPLLPTSANRNKIETVTKIAEKVVTSVSFPRKSSFTVIAKKFNLIPTELDPSQLKNPQDMSYVFGGAYVPLIGRITEQVIIHDSFRNIDEGMKLLPGQTIINFKTDKDACQVMPLKDFKSKRVLVYVLGGISFAEIAALRLLEKLHDCRIYIASTNLINGNSLMQMLSPPA